MSYPLAAIDETRQRLKQGLVIPAHPLALTTEGEFDEAHQRALTRYYLAAGAGGVAVGVHTTQFAIRDPEHNLLETVLATAAKTVHECDQAAGTLTVKIAGICGDTSQAINEAELASRLGYDAGLVSLGALKTATNATLINHVEQISTILPVVGFYLQPAAGGRLLSADFWRRFAEIPNVVAIKIAPFNRYQTLDVVRAVAEAGRAGDIALYTGNDDNIVVDLLTKFETPTANGIVRQGVVGGLLGHWACWTKQAVKLLEECKTVRRSEAIPAELLTKAAQITEANAALFDAANHFAGCIPGIHYVLKKQGLLGCERCLDPAEVLSPQQAESIELTRRDHPWMIDDQFVRAHIQEWLT